jgi:RNA polymerase-binding transcription factor DksA
MANALTPDDVRDYEERLRALHRRLLSDLQQLEREALGARGNPPTTQGDDGVLAQHEDRALDLIEQEDLAAHEVSLALERVRSGTFGRCVECDGWIGRGRLDAIPYARTCIDCQEG